MVQQVQPNKPASAKQKTIVCTSYKRTILCTLFVLTLLAGPWAQRYSVLSQEPPASNADANAEARSRDIVEHLNLVIQFYRACAQKIQQTGEPNDVVYRDQAIAQSSEIARFAFQSAKAEAILLAGNQPQSTEMTDISGLGEQVKMQTAKANVEKQIINLHDKEVTLGRQIDTAKPRDVAALKSQREQVRDAIELADAMKEALQKIVVIAYSQEATGLASDIDRLHHSVPELQSNNKTAFPQLVPVDSARSSGITSQGTVLFELVATLHSLDSLIRMNEDLHKQASALQTPMSKVLRGLIKQGQEYSQQAVETVAVTPAGRSKPTTISNQAPAPSQDPSAPTNLDLIITQFKAMSSVTIPLSQEVILLEQSRANLIAWRASADQEYDSILHALLLRVLIIAGALIFIIGGGKLWSRATNKYIHDIRRRRQFLIVRRVVVTFLSLIVIIFGFVTQFNSLATFAGFITAGIAVGLQTILLSVAAYFFIIGRYGIKVGDRITIATVTGDVIDVGLVRFYLMELAGSGTSLNPTGRIAVFSNAVLFQAGTPLYKQIPGTEYAWHELIIKLIDAADYKMVCEAVMKELNAVYEEYRTHIEEQHQSVEHWMQASIDPPGVESRLQFTGGAFQLWVRFPVEIEQAAATDERITGALFDLMAKSPEIKAAVAAMPVIQASVRG